MEQQQKENQEKLTWKNFFQVGEVGGYFFRKKDPNRPSNISLKMMHGVNKISILMFLACVIIIITRIIVRKYF
ncbi:MAG: hypothetical protein O9302_00880 [Cyclobacteriaceae bacterium]|jgi:hypothetical protein|nr:hypothetical protein [Flammeovirgaceae bacterium]MCZ8022279.1 hypothetical protein [Cytophagales bacterium]MCZ8326584.1 hypothetical protein [Cyclobacteriaceae bacterium]